MEKKVFNKHCGSGRMHTHTNKVKREEEGEREREKTIEKVAACGQSRCADQVIPLRKKRRMASMATLNNGKLSVKEFTCGARR